MHKNDIEISLDIIQTKEHELNKKFNEYSKRIQDPILKRNYTDEEKAHYQGYCRRAREEHYVLTCKDIKKGSD